MPGTDANPRRKRVWAGRPVFRIQGFRLEGDAIISNRIDIGTAKILRQLPAVERTSSRISNKCVENQRIGTDCGSGGRWFESTQLYRVHSLKSAGFVDEDRRSENPKPALGPPTADQGPLLRTTLSTEKPADDHFAPHSALQAGLTESTRSGTDGTGQRSGRTQASIWGLPTALRKLPLKTPPRFRLKTGARHTSGIG
jgi:hypothetical protein